MVKLAFTRSPKGYGYSAPYVYSVPGKLADQFIADGYAKPVQEVLPEDIPARELLIGAGLESTNQIKSFGDLTKINGIGDATARQIKAYLDK